MKNKRFFIITLFTTAVLLILFVGLGAAQESDPDTPSLPDSPSAEDAVSSAIPIQGQLSTASGSPLNGTYNITFRLYETDSGGTALCSDTDPVEVNDGLFNEYIHYCGSYVDGRRLYLGIQVGSDPEMTPRRSINPVPYALSLRPGAVISDTRDVVLTVRSTGSGDSDAFYAFANGTGEAIEAYATDGIGLFAKSDNSLALQAYAYGGPTDDAPGIFGCQASSSSVCDPYRDDSNAGVMGYSQYGFGGYFTGRDGGIHVKTSGLFASAIWATHDNSGNAIFASTNSTGSGLATLYLVQQNASGDFVVGASNYLSTRYWRVDRTGRGFFNGGVQSNGADFAEQIAVTGDEAAYEPGDVLVISASADRMVERSADAFATAVIGVYSTKPGILAGAPDSDDPLAGIPVAITGIVPCKVSAENGPIQRGDLLVTAATPGYAMRAGDNPPQGTVLGKAMGELDAGSGVIQILVTLQ